MVDEPRLSRWYAADDPLPDEALAWFRVAVGRRYRVRFGRVGLNYYRDGRTAWPPIPTGSCAHLDDTLVAILTLGAARPFLLRPQGGGPSIDLHPASGDLLVMGGTCQATWEHAVPKVAAGAGPRISASIRWAQGAVAPSRSGRRPTPASATAGRARSPAATPGAEPPPTAQPVRPPIRGPSARARPAGVDCRGLGRPAALAWAWLT